MSKFKDLTGQTFGRLTVLYRAEDKVLSNGQRKVMWHCICSCGNEVDVQAYNLTAGHTKSCGCLQKSITSERSFNDLTGRKFGRWLVLYKAEPHTTPSGQMKTMWHCICDCGNEADVEAGNLVNGASRSCGCLKSESKLMESARRIFDDEGNLIQKMCSGCKEFLDISLFSKNKNRADGFSEYCNNCSKYDVKKRYGHYKSGAKSRNLSFDITLNEFKNITSQPCVYCGEFSVYFNDSWINGIDRIDSSVGYISDNIVPCCEMCNRMKLNYNIDEWLDKIRKIAIHTSEVKINESN